jgi:hypothetical protein
MVVVVVVLAGGLQPPVWRLSVNEIFFPPAPNLLSLP